MPSQWIQRRSRDYYHRMAKLKGYRSRAAWKLIQAIRRYNFIQQGDYVVDLGSAPGGWLQVALEVVGEEGYVIAVDIVDMEPLPFKNVAILKADIAQEDVASLILQKVGRKVDVVLSDASPKVSGIREVDHARQIYLARRSLHVALSILREGGNFFAKAFRGPDLEGFVREVDRNFRLRRIVRPPASRPESPEIYILGLSLRHQ